MNENKTDWKALIGKRDGRTAKRLLDKLEEILK